MYTSFSVFRQSQLGNLPNVFGGRHLFYIEMYVESGYYVELSPNTIELMTQYALGRHMGKITVWMKVQAMKIIELLESQQRKQKR